MSVELPDDPPPDHARRGGEAVTRLAAIMARLRAPEGCPWDREQDHASLRPYVIEEAYEVADAIDRDDPGELAGELGDLLLQVVFHAEVGRDDGTFDLEEVADRIVRKLVRRHPHVFGEATAESPDDVVTRWEAIKRAERVEEASSDEAPSVLDGVARELPSALLAQRLADRAATVGFDWPDAEGPIGKIGEEIAELEAARESGDAGEVAREVGDVLLAAVNLARQLDVDAETALRDAALRFGRRFRRLEDRARGKGEDLEELDLEALERRWQAAKDEDLEREETA